MKEIGELNNIKVPRYYAKLSSSAVHMELHGFSDASASAYAAVIYVRTVSTQGKTSVQILASKTKVAPIKKQSIPRLELMAALLLSRLAHTIVTVLHMEIKTFYWTDSMSLLYWIQHNKAWKQYLGTRVREIQHLTNKEQWHHCPGVLNPADLPSRGLGASELVNCRMWWEGPAFLRIKSDKWPKCEEAIVLTKLLRKKLSKILLLSHIYLQVPHHKELDRKA